MSDLADVFAGVAEAAMALDPGEIRACILDTHDRLPGASGGMPVSGGGLSDPTANAALRPSSSDRALDNLEHHKARFVDAIAGLCLACHSRGVPSRWVQAVQDAHLLVELDMVSDLARVNPRGTRQLVLRAGDAVHDLEQMALRHLTRTPNDFEKSWTSGLADEVCCRVCLQLGLRVQRHARGLCQACWKLSQDSRGFTADGEPVDPPVEVVEKLRRTNLAGPAWVRERQVWLHGLSKRAG